MQEALSLDGLPNLPQMVPLARLAPILWVREEVVALWLGGSFARGEADEYSDVDLRVAVLPEFLERWKGPDWDALFAGDVVGVQFLSFGESSLHHLVLTDGTIFDLWVQSATQPPVPDATWVLGCREAGLAALLAEARLPDHGEPPAADPAAVRQILVEFWIGSHKHRKVLGRGLDLMVSKGMDAERTTLLRLWDIAATGRDSGAQRMTIHTLTRLVRAVGREQGPRALALVGLPLTSRREIVAAIEAHREEVARLGRDLADALGFAYPVVLEETVQQGWQNFREVTSHDRGDVL